MNRTTLARSAALVKISTPLVPALRCVTLFMTSSSEFADPLWKNVCGNANRESSDGGTNPSAPNGGAPFWRTSLNAAGLNVPTFLNSPMISPDAFTMPAPGGGVYRIFAVVHCGPPWHCWQFAAMNSARPAIASGSVLVKGEMGARIPNCSNALMASQALMPRTFN